MTSSPDSVFSRLVISQHVRQLSKLNLGYLQVILSEFSLHRRGRGKHLEVRIEGDPQIVTNRDGKRAIEALARADGAPGLAAMESQLAEFAESSSLTSCRVDCSNWPMRFANGGVLPVIHLSGVDYFLMFYRDIFPIGWNIANGASDDAEEWLDPTRIIEREFGEEVLLCDPTAKRLFVHDPPGLSRSFGFHDQAIAAWTRRWLELARFEHVPMPLKWIDGPDSVTVTFRGRTESHHGVFLSVTPPDHGIEVDRVALIRLSGDIRVLDGECANDLLFNHVVGLFEVKKFQPLLSGQNFLPDRVFYDGKEFSPDRMPHVIEHYLDETRQKSLRTPEQITEYQQAEVRFDLCPISRAVIQRYFGWLSEDQQGNSRSSQAHTMAPRGEPAEVFISHRSTNVSHARALHDYLRQRGVRVFFSDETLATQGDSDYARAIGQALDEARVLVLLAMAPEDLNSGWVDFEWKSFHCELLSDRKKGQLFSLLHNVSVEQLPLPLRSRQVLSYNPAAPFESFDNLFRFLKPALAAS